MPGSSRDHGDRGPPPARQAEGGEAVTQVVPGQVTVHSRLMWRERTGRCPATTQNPRSTKPMTLTDVHREQASYGAERRPIVPYVTTWSAEQDLPSRLVERRGFGIAYADEMLADRDERGVLWRRTPSRPRQGQPEFGNVHPLRQRQVMWRLLCQVCAGPADQTEDGTLWLLKDHREDWPNWPEGMGVAEPPVCLRCARMSVRLCPALRKGAVAIRVRNALLAGVRGALYRGGGPSPVAIAETVVAFDDPAVRWVCAVGLVRELRGCTIVPTAVLAGAAH
jgi:hypothetical protein